MGGVYRDTRGKFRNINNNGRLKPPIKKHIMKQFKQVLKKANKILKECARGCAYAINN